MDTGGDQQLRVSGSSSSADSDLARLKGKGPAGRLNPPPLSSVRAVIDTKRYLLNAGQPVCGLLVEWNKEGRPADCLSARLSSQCVPRANSHGHASERTLVAQAECYPKYLSQSLAQLNYLVVKQTPCHCLHHWVVHVFGMWKHYARHASGSVVKHC
jgi:hypothetical protein